jgi:hypothetical protein
MFDEHHDSNNHFRLVKPGRDYVTVACVYNDYVPERNTYDFIYRQQGMKWELVKTFINTFDLRRYQYIGLFDEDLVTDIDSMNGAIDIARRNNFKLWQMSIDLRNYSSVHQPLNNVPGIEYTKTNFIEGQCPLFSSELIQMLRDLHNKRLVKTGWGYDLVWNHAFGVDSYVVHKHTITNMKPCSPDVSSYSHHDGLRELNESIQMSYREFIKEYYGKTLNRSQYPYKYLTENSRTWCKEIERYPL